jgi:hypothetical protein
VPYATSRRRQASGEISASKIANAAKNVKIVKELETVEVQDAIHPRRRIVVLQRDDGLFTFAEEYFYVSKHDGEIIAEGWQQLPPNGIHESAAIAEAEGRAAFALWHRLAD